MNDRNYTDEWIADFDQIVRRNQRQEMRDSERIEELENLLSAIYWTLEFADMSPEMRHEISACLGERLRPISGDGPGLRQSC